MARISNILDRFPSGSGREPLIGDRAYRRNAARLVYRRQPRPRIDPARVARDLAAIEARQAEHRKLIAEADALADKIARGIVELEDAMTKAAMP